MSPRRPTRLALSRSWTNIRLPSRIASEIIEVIPSSMCSRTRILAAMVVNGKKPDLALLVRVREAFFHCGKAMIRSGMWEPERWASVDGLPSYAQALKDHGNLHDPLWDLERRVKANETDQLYCWGRRASRVASLRRPFWSQQRTCASEADIG